MFNTGLTVAIFNVNPTDWLSCDSDGIESVATPVTPVSDRSSDAVKTSPSSPKAGGTTTRSKISFEDAWTGLIEYLQALSVGWNQSKVTLMAVHATDSIVLWEGGAGDVINSNNIATQFLAPFIRACQPKAGRGDSLLGYAIPQALCYINGRKKNLAATARGANRIFLLDVTSSGDYSSQYGALVNAAFAAQKNGVAIDVCTVGDKSSAICQQLSDITSGVHLNYTKFLDSFKTDGSQLPKYPGMMFGSFLLFHFLTDNAGDKLKSTTTRDVSYAAVCCCHKTKVEIAQVCSCCLAIFCNNYQDPTCLVCKVRFKRDRDLTLANVKIQEPTI